RLYLALLVFRPAGLCSCWVGELRNFQTENARRSMAEVRENCSYLMEILMTLDEVASRVAGLLSLHVRPFATVDFGREQIDSARSIILRGSDVEKTLKLVRQDLPEGY